MRARGTWIVSGVVGAVLVAASSVVTSSAEAVTTPITLSSTVADVLVVGHHVRTAGVRSTAVTTFGAGVRAPVYGTSFLVLVPADGSRFTAGQTESALWTSDGQSSVVPDGRPHADYTTAGMLCQFVTGTGLLEVVEAEYDASGKLVVFSAHVRATCARNGTVLDTEIRFNSTRAVAQVAAVADSSLPSGAQGHQLPTIVNGGSTAIALGAVTVSSVPAGWTASVSRGTCGATLAAGSSCHVDVAWTSNGSPATFLLTVATPDGPTPTLEVVQHTVPALPVPVVTTRSAYDGVHVSWTIATESTYAMAWDVYRRPAGGAFSLAVTTDHSPYPDRLAGPGESVDYYVVAHRGIAPVALDATSAVVSGTRLAAGVTFDGVTDTAAWSTPSASWSTKADDYWVAFEGVPEGAGVLAVPGDVAIPLAVAVDNRTCVRPSGTLTVRDLARRAQGSFVRLDASFSGMCDDGTPLLGELRVGMTGTAFPQVSIAGNGDADPAWRTLPTVVQDLVTNTGTAPVSLGTPVLDAGGHDAEVAMTTTCTAVLAPQTSCGVAFTVTPQTVWSATVGATIPGAGLGGPVTTRHEVNVVDDTTPPVLLLARPGAFVDELHATIDQVQFADAQSGEASEDVRVRYAKAGASTFTPWLYPTVWQAMPVDAGWLANLQLHPLAAGTETCVSYRVRDKVGNTTPWIDGGCRTLVWNDTLLRPTAGTWTRGTGSQSTYDHGDWRRATTRGAALTGPVVRATRVAVLAVTCPTCGSADVYVGTRRVGSVTLHSNRWHGRVVLALPRLSSASYGALRVVVTSSGKPVVIDGIGASLT